MAFTITIKSIDDIKRYRIKIAGLKLQLFVFQSTTLRKLANIIITEKIHQNMRDAGFDEKIIKGTYLDNIELIGRTKVRLFFRSEYFSGTGFDVALAREEGTKRHFIKPKNAKALHGGNDWPFFSKGHWVDGILPLRIVQDTVKQRREALQDEYNRQQNMWYNKNLEGIEIAS